jgi:hypothetical protein
MNQEQRKRFNELRNQTNLQNQRERIKIFFELFTEGLTAPEVYRLDKQYFGTNCPLSSIRARVTELSGPKGRFYLEQTAKTKTSQYGKREHYYKLRKL